MGAGRKRRPAGERAAERPSGEARPVAPEAAARRKRLPKRLLERLASEILEHTKQLGLFDEARSRLLAAIETSEEFSRIRDTFRLDMERFCARADLGEPRARLRERLTPDSLRRSADGLRRLVARRLPSRSLRRKIRRLYETRALQYIRGSKGARRESGTKAPPAGASSA